MPTLAATLKSEIRRVTGRELKKTLKPLKRLNRQVRALRTLTRKQRVTIARLERRLLRLNVRAGALRRQRRSADKGPHISPAAIRLVRKRMKMTRLRFAKAVAVSPGSIFGWETGRSVPRGASRKKLVQLQAQLSRGGGRRRARRG